MHAVRTGLPRDVDHSIDPQVAFARGARADRIRLVGVPNMRREPITLGEDRDSRQAHLAARAGDTDRNLAPVGDENLLQL